MWYGREVIPSFDCDIEIKLRNGQIVDAKITNSDVNPKYGNDAIKWRFKEDIKYIGSEFATPYLPSEDEKPVNKERVQYFTIKHLENENAYLRQEVEILKERVCDFEIKGKYNA